VKARRARTTQDLPDATPRKSQVHRLRFKYGIKEKSTENATLGHAASEMEKPSTEELDQLYNDWGRWREGYSRSAVTKDKDKSVVIQGIAQEIAQIFSDQLVAGMWKGRIIDDLCFRAIMNSGDVPMRRPQKLPAPSWSWASTDQRFVFGEASRLQLPCTRMAELESLDVEPTKSGPLRWAVLRLKCNLVHAKATWATVPSATNPLHTLQEWRRMFGDKPESGMKAMTLTQTRARWVFGEEEMELDDYFVGVDHRAPDIYLVVLRRCDWHGEMTEALVLAQRPGPKRTFKGLGLIQVDDDNSLQLLAEHEALKSQIISLV
jgi:hypothetical protein